MKRPYIPPSCKEYVERLEEALRAIAQSDAHSWEPFCALDALPNELKPCVET